MRVYTITEAASSQLTITDGARLRHASLDDVPMVAAPRPATDGTLVLAYNRVWARAAAARYVP